MDDIALIILGIEEDKPSTKEGFFKRKKREKILSKINKDEFDLRPYCFKELDEMKFRYREEQTKDRNGSSFSTSKGYYEFKKGDNWVRI